MQGRARDCGSECIEALVGRIDAWIAREQAALDARPGGPLAHLHATGQARIFKDVNDGLMKGLGTSFALSLGISFLVMCALLRCGALKIEPRQSRAELGGGIFEVWRSGTDPRLGRTSSSRRDKGFVAIQLESDPSQRCAHHACA